MPGLGTVINCAGVIGGGLLGLTIKRGLPERFQNILIQAVGLCVIFLGISGTLQEIFSVGEKGITSGGTMMMIFSLSLGALLGELLNIEKHTEEFGEWIKIKSGSGGDTKFVDGFVSTSLTICIGAMAVVGAIRDGITGDISMLCAKAVLHYCLCHGFVYRQRMHLFGNPSGAVPGRHHPAVPGHRTSSDRPGCL